MDASLYTVRLNNQMKARKVFKKFNIVDAFRGTLVFYNVRIDKKVRRQQFTIFEDTYELNLIEKPFGDDMMFSLSVTGPFGEMMLQEDEVLPSRRKYAQAYRLVCAYYCYGKLAVVLEYDEQGFEGSNRRQMVVTGVLKTEGLQMQYD